MRAATARHWRREDLSVRSLDASLSPAPGRRCRKDNVLSGKRTSACDARSASVPDNMLEVERSCAVAELLDEPSILQQSGRVRIVLLHEWVVERERQLSGRRFAEHQRPACRIRLALRGSDYSPNPDVDERGER